MIAETQNHLQDQLELRRHHLEVVLDHQPQSHLQHLLQEVDDALARIEGEDYGICRRCLIPIEAERLLIDPLSHFCIECLSEDETRALEHDLETAAHIQSALLPPNDLHPSGWDIHYEYRPLGPVSGDHLDLVTPPQPGQPLLFLFGDVSGKGVAASLLMSHLHALFRTLLSLELPLEEVLVRANRIFCDSTMANSFATLVAGRLHPDGVVEVSNLGHLPPMLVRQDRVDTIDSTAMPFGLFSEGEFEVQRFSLEGGDSLFLYTDGLSEAQNSSGEEYGALRVGAMLPATRDWSARQTIDYSLKDLAAFRNGRSAHDDLTLMVCKVTD